MAVADICIGKKKPQAAPELSLPYSLYLLKNLGEAKSKPYFPSKKRLLAQNRISQIPLNFYRQNETEKQLGYS